MYLDIDIIPKEFTCDTQILVLGPTLVSLPVEFLCKNKTVKN